MEKIFILMNEKDVSMMEEYKLNSKILLELILRAYWMEKESVEELWAKFIHVPDELREVVNTLKKDGIEHQKILEEILRRLKGVPPFYIEEKLREYGKLPSIIPSESFEFLTEILDNIINFEKSMRDVYRMIGDVDDDAISYLFEIPVDEFRSRIRSILSDEEKHIQLLRSVRTPSWV